MFDPYGYTDEEYDALVLENIRVILAAVGLTPEEVASWWTTSSCENST